jgi:hypothetical protein
LPEITPPAQTAAARNEIASFAMLGASVPFTSPRLLGARIRPDPGTRGFELVLVHPAQAKGTYILPWRGMPDIGAPTLYDLRLWEKLSSAPDIHPTIIRQEALTVATEGLAGRLVASAAQEALFEERGNEAKLLAEFVTQCSDGVAASFSNAAMRKPDTAEDREAIEAITARDPALMQSLRALAATLSFVGPGTASAQAPLRRLMEEISIMVGECRTHLDEIDRDGEIQALRFLMEAAGTALHYTELAMSEIEGRLGDIVELIARPKINTAKLLERVRRPEWLLDGWGVPIALWRRAEPAMRRSIAWDLVSLVPSLPREVQDWFAPDQALESPKRISRAVTMGADWRTGQILDVTARNEDLISFSLHYENRVSPIGSMTGPANSDRVPAPRRHAKTRGGAAHAGRSHIEQSQSAKQDLDLTANLNAASDENLLRIVAMIDRLPDRSKLDVLLADVRPRLAQLRPPRPVTLTRLLFLPLSGALIDQADWRRDAATIPRTALHLISQAIGELLGETWQSMAKALRSAVFSDIVIVENHGQPLWEGAARAAERISPGIRWTEAGFEPEDFRVMVRLASGVWRHAGAIWNILRLGDAPVSVDALREALAGPASESLPVYNAAFKTLLRSISNPSALAVLASGAMPPGTSEIVIEGLEEWINEALPLLPSYEAHEATERAEELGKTIEALGLTPFFQIPRRKRQLSAFFWRLEEHCRVMLLEILNDEILPALSPAEEPYSDATFGQLERQARIARRLEILGRHFGNDPSYDVNQQRLIRAFVTARKDMSGLAITPVDLLRLGEILLGREKARSLLGS